MDTILSEASAYFLDTREEVYQVTSLPHVICELVHGYVYSEKGFEKVIMTAGRHALRRNELATRLLSDTNPHVSNWCVRVIGLHRTNSEDRETPDVNILAYILCSVSHSVCNRPSCWYGRHHRNCGPPGHHCNCGWPLRVSSHGNMDNFVDEG